MQFECINQATDFFIPPGNFVSICFDLFPPLDCLLFVYGHSVILLYPHLLICFDIGNNCSKKRNCDFKIVVLLSL